MISATQSNHPIAGVAMTGPTPAEFACARLRQAGMRVTKPRIAIIELLSRHPNPISIEKVHTGLNDRKCDLVTVYRCLATFEELGLVRRSFLHSGTCLYELTLGGRPDCYHVFCRQCGRIDPVDYFAVEAPMRSLEERGYTAISHVVEFFGVCPQCRGAAMRDQLTTIATRA